MANEPGVIAEPRGSDTEPEIPLHVMFAQLTGLFDTIARRIGNEMTADILVGLGRRYADALGAEVRRLDIRQRPRGRA